MAGKKISQLSSSLSPSLTGYTVFDNGSTTYKTTLQTLRNVLVDSGSHNFTGSQTINGNLIVSGSITAQSYILSSSVTHITVENISGSSNFGNSLDDKHTFTGSLNTTGSVNIIGSLNLNGVGNFKELIVGTGSFHLDYPEVLHVENTGSINVAHFEGVNNNYVQLNVKNKSTHHNASTDIVATADNGTETIHYVDMGINSSTYDGGFVGRENDAYLLNVGKDLYVGTVGGTFHPSNLKLFAQNLWEVPQISISGSRQIAFNTGSVSSGYTYEFSGSAKLQNDVDIVGELTIGSVNEKLVLNISGGTSQYEFDYHSGSVFYLTSSLSNNVYNVSNVPTENNKAVSVTFVIKQESTPYIASSYKLNNQTVAVSWAGNEQPTGNANKTDVIGLTALRVGSSWNVLGTFTTFG